MPADNYAARAATAAELVKFRGSAAIFTARINQAVFTPDITAITYDGATGDYADIYGGMRVHVGSAAGLFDRGVFYTSGAATATDINIVEQSSTGLQDNDYITVYRIGASASALGLAIVVPDTVYTARVNGTPATLDGLAEIVYDGGSGTLADVADNMELWIGSAAGLCDKGIVRIRKAPTATSFYIGTSGLQDIDNDDYLTVKRAFSLWQRDLKMIKNKVLMDFEIQYSNTIGGCIPRVAPLVAVLHLDPDTGTVTFNPPDPTDTACYDGETILSWLYECEGATVTDGDTSSPTLEFNATGQYLMKVTITDSLYRETITYRWIFVDPAPVIFTLGKNPTGDFSSGDWSCEITVYEDTTTSAIVDRALVTLYADDYYHAQRGSIGKIAGYENILMSGWVDGETISRDAESGSVTFEVHGPAYWLNKLRASSLELQYTGSSAPNWNSIEGMTIDKALAHVLFWTTTAPTVMDCYFSGDTIGINALALQSGTIYEQLRTIAMTRGADILCNNYGQMYVEIDSQIETDANRATIPTVMSITEPDWVGALDIVRNTSAKTAMVELQASEDFDGGFVKPILSRAPGNQALTWGRLTSTNNMFVADQTECNRVSGMLLASQNNEYDPIEIVFTANNRLFDIAPRMYATLTYAAGDSPRGISFTDRKLVPRRVEFVYDGSGNLQSKVTFEFETTGVAGVTYVPPSGDTDPDYEIGDIGSVDFPTGDLFPPVTPTDTLEDCSGISNRTYSLTWTEDEMRGNDATTLISRSYFPCNVRATGTSIEIYVTYYGDAANKISAYAIKSGSRILSANSVTWFNISGADGTDFVKTGRIVITFSPLSNTAVDGFELELAAGIGIDTIYVVKDTHVTGSFDADDTGGGGVHSITSGNWYAIENVGGPWQGDQTANPALQYKFMFRWRPSPLLWSDWWGWAQASGGDPYVLEFGTLDYELVGGYVVRLFYQAISDTVIVRAGSDTFADNSGSMGYKISNVELQGRGVDLGGTTINNVCALGT